MSPEQPEQFHRQSPLQIVFILIGIIKKSWFVFLIPLSRLWRKSDDAKSGNTEYLVYTFWLLAIYFLVYALISVIQYFMFRFAFDETKLVIKKGIGIKRNLVIPRTAIQGLQLHQNLLHRITNTYKLGIDSAGTTNAEAELSAVNQQTAIALEQWVAGIVPEQSDEKSSPIIDNKNVYALSSKDFFLLWFSENHLKTIALILLFIVARIQDLKEWFGYSPENYLRQQADTIQWTTSLIASLTIIGIGLALVVSGIRVFIRYINYRVEFRKKQFILSWGLLSTKKTQVPFDKLQSMSWQANWLRRKLDLWMVKLHTLNNLEEAAFRQKAFPITGNQNIEKLTKALVAKWPGTFANAKGVSKAMINRFWLLYGILPTLMSILVLWYWLQEWALIALCYCAYYRWVVQQQHKNILWCTDNTSLLLQKGVWGRKYWLIDFEKVQTAWCSSGPWMRRNGLRNIYLYTGAVTISIPMLPAAVAEQLLHQCMVVSSFGKQPSVFYAE